jgi:hypothetical protein
MDGRVFLARSDCVLQKGGNVSHQQELRFWKMQACAWNNQRMLCSQFKALCFVYTCSWYIQCNKGKVFHVHTMQACRASFQNPVNHLSFRRRDSACSQTCLAPGSQVVQGGKCQMHWGTVQCYPGDSGRICFKILSAWWLAASFTYS